jgi:hypothetical protein
LKTTVLGNCNQLIQQADDFLERPFILLLQVVTGSIICPTNGIECLLTDELPEMTNNKALVEPTTVLLQEN